MQPLGEIAPLAVSQLAAWEKLAEEWQDRILLDEEGVGRCDECGKGVILWLDRNMLPYRYTHEQVIAQTVLHLRNHHPGLDPDKPAQTL